MKTIVAVQCRLSSTRLPRKALKDLGGKSVLDWTLCAMKRVKADGYFVATDEKSAEALEQIAKRNGFEIFVGPLEDVLERFCLLIEKTGADAVVRATADNPFLFYEAANALIEQYVRRTETGKCDYATFMGLPHGSGVEILNAHSLLEAKKLTDSPFDHEHVGPALYNHSDRFACAMIPSPAEWNFPSLRTTIDTPLDYRKALALVRFLSAKNALMPYSAKEIVEAVQSPDVSSLVLCVPCVKKGRGTGHLRRCLSVACQIGADIFIPEDAGLLEADSLIQEAKEKGLSDWQIVRALSDVEHSENCAGGYSLILTDAFSLERPLAQKLSRMAPVVAIDEGSLNTDFCDCLLDIIPSYGIERPANISNPAFVPLPKNVREKARPKNSSEIRSVLISFGGEDPADLVVPAACAFASASENQNENRKITAITTHVENAEKRIPEKLRKKIEFLPPIQNLKEKLFEFDLVVTHYGFTAFEALAAGCAVLLIGTTALHTNLAKKYGFLILEKQELLPSKIEETLKTISALYPSSPLNAKERSEKNAENRTLGSFVRALSKGRRFLCPICAREDSFSSPDPIVARTSRHTFRRCASCGILYMSWTFDEEDTKYDEAYFFEDYKKQYGKTYLDDFQQIKGQCVRRTGMVDMIFRKMHRKSVTPTTLDVGCAFGPYLDAANDSGWQVFGTDASVQAVDYVRNTLHYPAALSKFPAFDPMSLFGVKQFDAVTMWYVIEHFQNLDSVLRTVSKIVKTGGVFAFSTPSASGVSGRFNSKKFFESSPADHYTLWEPKRASSILKKYGFKLIKTVSTGHHPERFPAFSNEMSKESQNPKSFKMSFYRALSHTFSLGDTFEAYCVKEKDV